MRKVHLLILITTLILMVLSGYSIAAVNMIYNIKYDWYSRLSNDFSKDFRDTSFYELQALNKNILPRFEIIESQDFSGYALKRIRSIFALDFSKYIYIYCTLGESTHIDSNIKISQIAQRGNTVEIIAFINSTSGVEGNEIFFPEDIVRINRNMIISKGKTLFILKNQFGARIAQVYKNIDE